MLQVLMTAARLLFLACAPSDRFEAVLEGDWIVDRTGSPPFPVGPGTHRSSSRR
jgi:hypothetical protein